MAESKNGSMEIKIRRRRWISCNDVVPSRYILFILLFTGMISLYTMRLVMPITLLAMVKDQNQTNPKFTNESKLCFEDSSNSTTKTSYGGTLEWSMDVQYYILTSFFWTHIVGQIIGGIVSQKFSGKSILLYAFLISAVCSFCIPSVSNVHYALLIVVQMVHGFAQAMVWPNYSKIMGFWAPVVERNRGSISFLGLSLGITFSQVMAGFVIGRWGWTYVFYIAGGTGLLWTVAWYFLAFDTPEQHPRISPEELQYIQDNRGFVANKSYSDVPWTSILLSVPVWAIILTSFGRIWVRNTLNFYGPLYLKDVLGLNVQNNGLWSGLPSVLSLFVAFCLSYVSDTLTKYNVVSTLTNRKLFTGIPQILIAVLCFYFTRLNCNEVLVLTCWCSIQVLLSASFFSPTANVYDIAPNYVGPIQGFSQMITMSPSVIASYVSKTVLQNQNTMDAWQTIFVVAAALNLICVVIYLVCASAEVQSWDGKNNLDKQEANGVAEELLTR